jgi:hypothetical protein
MITESELVGICMEAVYSSIASAFDGETDESHENIN